MDVDKIIAKLTRVADNAENLTSNLAEIVSKVSNGKGSIGRLLNNDKIARDLEGAVRQAQTTMKGVHATTATLNEDLQAAQHNFLLKGFFNKKKKALKAKQDSLRKVQEKLQKAQEKAAKEALKAKEKADKEAASKKRINKKEGAKLAPSFLLAYKL